MSILGTLLIIILFKDEEIEVQRGHLPEIIQLIYMEPEFEV